MAGDPVRGAVLDEPTVGEGKHEVDAARHDLPSSARQHHHPSDIARSLSVVGQARTRNDAATARPASICKRRGISGQAWRTSATQEVRQGRGRLLKDVWWLMRGKSEVRLRPLGRGLRDFGQWRHYRYGGARI